MKLYPTQTIRNCYIFGVIAAILLSGEYLFSITLAKTSFASGTLLLFCIIILACYQLRKKLSFLSMGSTTAWLHFHIFIAFLSFLLFLMHVKLQIPDGLLESMLYLVYCIVFFSGLIGWCLSRIIPYRLLTRGQEVIFERIPMHRRKIRESVETLVFENQDTSRGPALPDFYEKYLRTFLSGPRNQFRHILHSRRHRHQLSQQIAALRPFLNDQERVVLQQIEQQIQIKDDLDYQYALQGTLKLWLFVHVPFTYSLIIFALFHTLAVCAFASTNG